MRDHIIFPIIVIPALLAVLCIAYVLGAAEPEPQTRHQRIAPTDVEGWHSLRRDARAATPSAMPAVGSELDPALQSLDGVTAHG